MELMKQFGLVCFLISISQVGEVEAPINLSEVT